jgi:hypothetical protein
MSDAVKWSYKVQLTDIDSERYFSWVEKQYQLLAHLKSKDFQNITLEKFSESLRSANWRNADDGSAIVNAYLLNADLSSKPEIFLGRYKSSLLSVRVNGRCLNPPKTDLSTAESYGVTAINPNILLSIRYVTSNKSKKSFLCIPVGKISPCPLNHSICTKPMD